MKLKSQLIRLFSAEKESRAHAHTHTYYSKYMGFSSSFMSIKSFTRFHSCAKHDQMNVLHTYTHF